MMEVNNLAFDFTVEDQEPRGSWQVNTIDDAERLTRNWLKRSLEILSGYPSVDTVAVKTWTSNTRPGGSPNNNCLLGYNTQTKQLEVIGTDGNAIEILSNETKKSIALLAHPVGTYYWTSETSFNPETAWGGKWVRINDGRCLFPENSKWGSEFVAGYTSKKDLRTTKIEKENLPPHDHPHKHPHKHDRGDMNITGKTGSSGFRQDAPAVSGAFYRYGVGIGTDDIDEDNQLIAFDASLSWTGHTSEDNTKST